MSGLGSTPGDVPASHTRPVRLAIVDDHESVRLGVAAASQAAGHTVVATGASTSAVDALLGDEEVDVVVLDLSLGDGSSITDNVKWAQVRGAAVLVHSIADRVVAVREALAAGAAGVIPKASPMSTVVAALETVARGDVLNNLEWASAIDADDDFARAELGKRERAVLHLYASGLPLKLVAGQLQISLSTAKEYLDRIRDKYVEVGRPAPTKVDLLRRAVEDGILPSIDLDEPQARP